MSRLFIISNTSWNLFNFRLPLMHRLKGEGFEVVAVAPRDEYSKRIEEADFRYIELPMNNKGTNPIEDFGLLLRMIRLFRNEKPAVVLTYTPKPNIYASLAGGLLSIPVIPNISGLGNVFIRQSLITRIIKWLYRAALAFPAVVFFQNQDDRQLFVKLGLVKEGKTERIPGSGINTEVYAPAEVSKEGERFVFLLVARMLWDKGVGEYVEAARELKAEYPETCFQLLGFLDVVNPQAISREQMQQWVDEGIIEYLGVSDDVKTVMMDADCIVLPSYREGLPRTLIEGASLARPLITTDVPGCRDVVENGATGFLCTVKDSSSLESAMRKMLLLSAEQRQEMGLKGRKKMIAEFDESIVIEQYLKVVRAACSGNQTG